MEPPSTRISTVLPASAVPVKVGAVTLVMLSVLDNPVSLAAIKSGVEGTGGAVVSTRTPVVLGGVKVGVALLPTASLIVPPFKIIGDDEAMPSVSVSPACAV